MKIKLSIYWFAALLLSSLTLQAHSAKLALVIGNDGYQSITKLANAGNDASLMASTLKDAGYAVTLIKDANRNQLWTAIDRFQLRIAKGDEVVFYFSGHGVQVGVSPILLPTDIQASNENQLQRDGVPLIDIQDKLKDARFSLLVIDACRDNPFAKTGRSVGSPRGLAPIEVAEGFAIIMSAGRGQKALDNVPGTNVNNGLFTYEFTKVIRQSGADVSTALKVVRDNVETQAKLAGNLQRPSISEDIRGKFYLFPQSASVGKEPFAQVLTASLAPNPSPLPISVATASSVSQLSGPEIDGFIVSADGIVLDKKHGLMWMRCSLGQSWDGAGCTGKIDEANWDDSKAKVKAFNSTEKFAGYSDWRLPTIRELATLIRCSSGIGKFSLELKDDQSDAMPNGCMGDKYAQPTIRASVFPSTPDTLYWAQTPVPKSDSFVWGVDFGHGYIRDSGYNKMRLFGTRLVRTSN